VRPDPADKKQGKIRPLINQKTDPQNTSKIGRKNAVLPSLDNIEITLMRKTAFRMIYKA